MWEENINGKVKYRERLKDPVTGRTLNFCATVKKNTAAGRREARERLYEKMRTAKDTRMRFSDLVKLFISDQKSTVKDSTRRRNQNTLERLTAILDDPYIDKLTSGYVRRKLIELNREPDTLNEYLRRFRTFWRWAYKNNYIESSAIADRLDNFKTQPHRLKIQDKYMEPDQALEVIEALPEDHALVCKMMLLSGLRFGELSALDRDDVGTTTIEIYKTRDAITGAISETKTQGSTRTLHITPELKDHLEKVMTFMDHVKELTGSDCPALFLNDAGERVNLPAFNKALKTATMKILGRPLTSHALRHSYASMLMAADVSLQTIQRSLGHSKSDITERIYLHVMDELRQKDNAALDSAHLLKKSGKKVEKVGEKI